MLRCQKILDAEENFVKLNEELDIETQGLLQQLDDVMKCRNSQNEQQLEMKATNSETPPEAKTADYQPEKNGITELETLMNTLVPQKTKPERAQTSLPVPSIGGALTQPPKLTRHRSEVKIRDRFDGGIVPDAVKSMGQEGVVRFLKAKVQILTEQLENVQKDEKKMMVKVKEFQSERERVAEDRDKWIQQANLAKNMLARHESHASNIVLQMQNAQAENGHLKRDIEKLKKEHRLLTQNSGSNEVRLNRSIEEVERLKNTIKQMKQDDKELREAHKKKTEELTAALKKIEKQKIDLLHAFKKQFAVIDNLKKQRGLADAGKQLKSIEEDFMEFLDWSPNDA